MVVLMHNGIIDCEAMVAWAPNEAPEVERIKVARPKRGEVRIQIACSSICQTDVVALKGGYPEVRFPCILGHEAAGRVESCGEGVTNLLSGDLVVPIFAPQCGQCRSCKSPKANLCQKIRINETGAHMEDGSSRFSLSSDGTPIHHFLGCSTWSEYTVVPAVHVARVNESVPLERACLFSCGFTTGYGAALNTANVQKGDTVAIFGLGAVGLAVAEGCHKRGVARIIGVDINEKRIQLARDQFGITEFVNPSQLPANKRTQDVLVELTDGGLDHTFECIGNPDTMTAAVQSSYPGSGQTIILGVHHGELTFKVFELITGRTLKGCVFGGWKSLESVPKLVDRYLNGYIQVDKFATHHLEGIQALNEAIELLKTGSSLRTVVKF